MSTKLTDAASIEAIISEMTTEEKAFCITGASSFTTNPMEKYGIPAIWLLDGGTGVNSGQYFGEVGQQMAMKELAEAGTPVDPETLDNMGGMALSFGYNEKARASIPDWDTKKGCYPPGMFFGATWNPEPIEACGRALSKEMNFHGIDVILGTPNVNIHRDPLNGRLFEGYSEDPWLVSHLAPCFVKGVQAEGCIADVKHYAANNQETERMGVNESISERALREIYLPGFKACIEAGCLTIMSAYNSINGVPCAQNPWLLKQVLRDEWHFDGFVVSDWAAAYDRVEAVAAGNDLTMPGPRGIRAIVEAVENGTLAMADLDSCVRNYLKVVIQTPTFRKAHLKSFDLNETLAATEFAAKEGITLLENDGTLPMCEAAMKKTAFYGKRSRAFAGSGAGSAEVETSLQTNPFDCAADLLGRENVTFGESTADTKVWIVTVGANGQEGTDRQHMEVDEDDKQALEQAIAEAKAADGKIIVILNTEGPVDLLPYRDRVNAILCAYYPGMQGGKVLLDIITGSVNPSGKLPITWPKHYYDCPTYGNFPGEDKKVMYGEGIYVGYRYYDTKHIEPLYPFGYGLSYTGFEITDVTAAPQADLENGTLRVSVTVKNTGKRDGSEVVQLYVHDPVSRMEKPEKELKGFRKVFLHAGEEKTVTLEISKADLAVYSTSLRKWVTEPGTYELLVGCSSRDIRRTVSVEVLCKNPFGLQERIGVAEVTANAEAVRLISGKLGTDLVQLVGPSVVFFPRTPWCEVWERTCVPYLKKAGRTDAEIAKAYAEILTGFETL